MSTAMMICWTFCEERDCVKNIKGKDSSFEHKVFRVCRIYVFCGNDLRPWKEIVVKYVGKYVIPIVDSNILRTHNCHVGQVQFQEPNISNPISVFSSEQTGTF